MRITIVDSVKGGCGKTTIALKRAVELCKLSEANSGSEKDKQTKNKPKVCVIDFDLLGSSIEVFMLGDTSNDETPNEINEERNFDSDADITAQGEVGLATTEKLKGISFQISKKSERYLNQFFYTDNKICADYINEVSIYSDYKETDHTFDILICSPYQKEKNMFKATTETQYIERIDYGYFRSMVIRLIKILNDSGYTDIIFDMPPNSDSYTDVVFEVLYRHKSQFEFDYQVEMLLVSSLDITHIKANTEWVKNESINCDWKNKFFYEHPHTFKLVFNDTVNYEQIAKKNIDFILQRRLSFFNGELNGYLKIDEAYFYEYDQQAALSVTEDKGVVFGYTELRKGKME